MIMGTCQIFLLEHPELRHEFLQEFTKEHK